MPASAQHGAFPRTDEYLGSSIASSPASVWADPGRALADRNPRMIAPGTTSLVARGIVLQDDGMPFTGVRVTGHLEIAGSTTSLEFKRVADGVYDSAPVGYEGGAVGLVVKYDFNADGVVDHESRRHVYRPVL